MLEYVALALLRVSKPLRTNLYLYLGTAPQNVQRNGEQRPACLARTASESEFYFVQEDARNQSHYSADTVPGAYVLYVKNCNYGTTFLRQTLVNHWSTIHLTTVTNRPQNEAEYFAFDVLLDVLYTEYHCVPSDDKRVTSRQRTDWVGHRSDVTFFSQQKLQ